MSKRSKLVLPVLLLSAISLTSCGSEPVRLPDDHDQPIFPNLPEGADVTQGDKDDYYNSVTTPEKIYEKMLNEVLLDISKVAHNYTEDSKGSDVTKVFNNTYQGSVSDAEIPSGEFDNLLFSAKEQMVDAAISGTYDKDDLFYESKYIDALREAFTLPTDITDFNKEGILITPDYEFEDIFKGNFDAYKDYMAKYLYDAETINYLTAEYIYTKSYSSIGNSNARNVQIIAITDRDDMPGAAKKLIDAYIEDYVMGTGENGDKYLGKDPDFTVLSRLWKGITSDVVSALDPTPEDNDNPYSNRYTEEIVLSAEEKTWLESKGIVSGKNDSTLSGKVISDKAKIEAGLEDFNKADLSLESTYTGSYTYDYRTGVRKAIDDIATKDLVTEGIFLKADGLSELPADLKDRIFSTNYTTNKDDIEKMKADYNYTEDITRYMPDGNRYLTVPNTVATDPSNIVYYDASSKTYYITRILDVVTTNAISSSNTNSVYSDEKKREQIAREVAYTMSTTGSYKTESTVYWLRRSNVEFSDDEFLEYMKTNYNDLFRTDSAYDSEPKIILE